MSPEAVRWCEAIDCDAEVEWPRVFCARHWDYLVPLERRALVEAWGTRRWLRELGRARDVIWRNSLSLHRW